MFTDIVHIMREDPEIVIFLSLAIGYFVGKKLKIFGFTLGSTASILLASIVVGQVGIRVPAILKNISFALFIFTVGYKVGPQFFGSLKKDGINYLWIAIVVSVTSLAATVAIAKFLHLDQGTAAGMFAGSMTTSAALGTGEGAIRQLAISQATKMNLDSNLAVAYAITYIFGTAGTIVFLKLAPKLFGIDLKQEAKKLQARLGGSSSGADNPDLFSWTNQLGMRAYIAGNAGIIGKSVSEIENLFPDRVSIDRIKRGQEMIVCAPETKIADQDTLLIIGPDDAMIKAEGIVGPEIDRALVVDMTGEAMDVCILNKNVVGKTLGELGNLKIAHGLFLRRATRQGHELPITKGTVIHKCDVLHIIGIKDDVERAVASLGYPERPTIVTDLVTVAVGCIVGTLLGLIVVPVFGMPITLGVGGGVLVAGLLCGWLRSIHPTFGQIPGGAQWILSDLGLNLFVACIGISAGPEAFNAIKTTGVSVFFGGIVITILPIIVMLIFGLKILKMNPILLFGAATGAHNCTASLNAIIEESESSLPVLGYAAPYAFANVLLTVWGSVIINIT
ncbi:MAG: aspartate-alanine antiporter [Deltaproteobacteria bacterium CG11_big_fil_rev_8_21_14_0_20_49_13]|nr:MAG: aspartate-alanine antiporter [Deltaproteobacteria bacterium CG11_big_fil_rev_8_21_14_0_20_49_13]